MLDSIKKHWTGILGLGLVFTGIIYFLKIAVDHGLLPPQLRVALAICTGLSALFFGRRFYRNGKDQLGQTTAGMGAAILYACIGYISFSAEFNWSTEALITTMICLSAAIAITAFHWNMRILFLVSTVGGLATPFLIEASSDMDTALFCYMLVINLSALTASIWRSWDEAKIISFIGSLALFGVYYSLFDPVQWAKPFSYLSIMSLVFAIGMLASSSKKDDNYAGHDLLLGLINAVNFTFWSIFIFREFSLPHAWPLVSLGVLFAVMAWFIYRNTASQLGFAVGVYGVLSLLVLGIAGHDAGGLFQDGGLHHAISTAIWLASLIIIYVVLKRVGKEGIHVVLGLPLIVLIAFWYKVAWSVDWVPVMGVTYIPFLNAGGLIWIGMVWMAFELSKSFVQDSPLTLDQGTKTLFSQFFALVGHVLIGGLLSIQIMNLWDAYEINFINQDMSLSLCWFVYALILFLWASRTGQRLFARLGAGVLILSTLKVYLWDLTGKSDIQHALFLLMLGGVTLLISKIRLQPSEPSEEQPKSIV